MSSPSLLEKCASILSEIKALPEAGLCLLLSRNELEAFLQPVPWREWNLEDYPKIIHQPMDLGTVTVFAF